MRWILGIVTVFLGGVHCTGVWRMISLGQAGIKFEDMQLNIVTFVSTLACAVTFTWWASKDRSKSWSCINRNARNVTTIVRRLKEVGVEIELEDIDERDKVDA